MTVAAATPLDEFVPADLDSFAAELDALGAGIREDLGASDAAYIRRVIAVQRGLEASGAGCCCLLATGLRWPAARAS